VFNRVGGERFKKYSVLFMVDFRNISFPEIPVLYLENWDLKGP